MTPKAGGGRPGKSKQVRGSTTGRPIMVLFDVLGRRWTLRILWELRDAPLTFRSLRSRCAEVSPTVLNSRLKELRRLELVDHGENGYALTRWGVELGEQLMMLSGFAQRWGKAVDPRQ